MSARLSDAALRLVAHMSDGELVLPLAITAADAGVPIKEARAIVRDLHQRGLAEFGPLFSDEDGGLGGRGYWLSRTGLALKREL